MVPISVNVWKNKPLLASEEMVSMLTLPLKLRSVILKFSGQKALEETIRAPSLRSANRSVIQKSVSNYQELSSERSITFQLMVKIGTKSEVIDKNYTSRVDLLAMTLVEKVSFDNSVFSIAFPPPTHQPLEMVIHILQSNTVINTNSIDQES